MTISEDVGSVERDAAATARRFEQLFRSEVDRIHSYARARLGAAEAEDVVSEVFQAVAVAIRNGNDAAWLPAWIMTVTKNVVIDRWRRTQRRTTRDALLRVRERDRMVQTDDWTDPGDREQVIAALDRLSTRHRMVLVMHYADGLSAPEIADELGRSVAAIESMLARARRAFRSEFVERGRTT